MKGAARVVVMGVSGCGKSTVAEALAQQLGWRCLEGDDLHSAANVAKMASGIPLQDADRAGWLDSIAQALHTARSHSEGLVVSCSALKRIYRDRLRQGDADVVFVHLQGARELLHARMLARTHRYMKASLLDSQLATLEPPGADEQARGFDIALPPERIVHDAQDWLAALGYRTTRP